MRYIAIIVVVAIIAIVVIFALLIQRLKNRQAEELVQQAGRLDLAQSQLAIANTTLRTIRDLRGDSAVDADIAIEQIDRLRTEYYDNQEKRLTR